MNQYTYIIAPHISGNYAILQQATEQYSDLVNEKRIRAVYKRSEGDIIDADGDLIAPADPAVFLYVKATTAELDFELLSGVSGAQMFTAETQPFGEYWI